MLISHNSFSYLKPKKWWMNFLVPLAKCQVKSLPYQDVDMIDIRVKLIKGTWYISHGPVIYCSLEEGLRHSIIAGASEEGVRLLFEHQDLPSSAYEELESYLTHEFPELKFWVARDKKTWKKLMNYPDIPNLTQYVGSMQSKIGKVFPFLWWILKGKNHKREYLEKSKTENISIDFI